MNEKLHTGEKIEDSGIYRILGTKNEMILSEGDRVPPYEGERVNIVLVRKARHGNS